MKRMQGKSQILNKDETLKVERDSVKYVQGKPIQEPKVLFDVKANVQPVNGFDLMIVPEGDRFKEQYWVWTETEIKLGDKVIRNGIFFQCQQIRPWGSYHQVRIVRVDVGPDSSNRL